MAKPCDAPLQRLHQGRAAGADDQGIAQRAAEDLRFDLEDVVRLGPDAVGEAQGGGAEVVDVQVPGTAVLRVLEEVVLQVRPGMVYVVLDGRNGDRKSVG